MEEEVQDEPVIETPEPEPPPVKTEADVKIEKIAQELGWNPDYDGEDGVDAETFIKRSRDIQSGLSKKLKGVSKELAALREGIGALQAHHKSQYEKAVAGHKAEIERLKAEQDEAVETGDTETYKKLKKEIAQKEKEAAAPPPDAQAKNPDYVSWIEEGNEWYENDTEMQTWANSLIASPEYKALPYKRLLSKLTKTAKDMFPDKFEQEPEPEAPKVVSKVSPTTPKAAKKRSASSQDLTYEQKQIARDFIEQGVIKNMDEYAQMLENKYGGK